MKEQLDTLWIIPCIFIAFLLIIIYERVTKKDFFVLD